MEILVFIVIGIVSRLGPHLPNATAVGALALLTGAYYGTTRALVVTLTTMLVTDLLLGLHPVMWATYGCLIAAAILGSRFLKVRSIGRIAGATLASSILFFLVTNFAVWLSGALMYPQTWTGLMQCYLAGLPFFRNSLIGDLVYSGIFFSGYALVCSLSGRLNKATKA